MKQFLKLLTTLTPYRIVRDRGGNRFDAMEACLAQLCDRGFRPKVVIDGGAHLGSFSLAAAELFPTAQFHLIEPQPACHTELRSLAAKYSNFTIHEVALARQAGTLDFVADGVPGTGAHVSNNGTIQVRAESLDALLNVSPDERALLKLDLQGFELEALNGACRALQSVEILLTEVSFFAQSYEPPIAKLVAFLDDHGFVLYDIAALSARFRDNRLRQGDFVFVRKGTSLLADNKW